MPRDWIVIHDGTCGEDAYSLECLRCGAKQAVELPVSVTYITRLGKAFEAEHKRCEAAGGEEEVMKRMEIRALLDWFMCSDPWPKEIRHHHRTIEVMLNAKAKELGFTDWVHAYHRYDPAS